MGIYEELEQLLASDDEFKSEGEISSILVNENNCCFDLIEFKWVFDNNHADYPDFSIDNADDTTIFSDESEEENHTEPKRNIPRLLFKIDVLKKQDLFCLKAIAPSTTSNIILWLIEFMFLKDIQSDYAFLTSCLVLDT